MAGIPNLAPQRTGIFTQVLKVTPTVLVAQLGARRLYAVPWILEQAGMLDALYTDLYLGSFAKAALDLAPAMLGFGPVTGLQGRSSPGVPSTKVTSFPLLAATYVIRRGLCPGNALQTYIAAGQEFCRSVVRRGWGGASGVYAFNTAGLELLRAARQDGLRAVIDQTIAPKRVEERLLSLERSNWPDWERTSGTERCLGAYVDREEAEWTLSDCIVCGSEFVREGIRECGGPVAKCHVAGSGVDLPITVRAGRERDRGSLRVLTVGEVGLRKGSPYVLKAAGALRGLCVFRMVGPIRAPASVLNRAPCNVEILGPVPRSKLAEHYQWGDVFFLPTICEGAAISCYEALSFGLPVVCTYNAGISIIDSEEGYLLPAGDLHGFIKRLANLAVSQDLLSRLSLGASHAARRFSLAQYGRRLVLAIRSLFA